MTDTWANAAKLPFVVAMNCLNGLFNVLYGDDDDEASLAEAMVRAPNGGAVAVWASSSITPSATQALVNQELFRLIFSGTYATLGEAVAAAKRVVSNQDLRRSWIFFGDPAMRLIGAPQPTGQQRGYRASGDRDAATQYADRIRAAGDDQRGRDGNRTLEVSVVRPHLVDDGPHRRSHVEPVHHAGADRHDGLHGASVEPLRHGRLQHRGDLDATDDHDTEPRGRRPRRVSATR